MFLLHMLTIGGVIFNLLILFSRLLAPYNHSLGQTLLGYQVTHLP